MSNEKLQIKAALRMMKPVHDVYEAIVDPERMKNYFIATGSGRMEEGKELTWKFPEMDMEFPIRVGKVEQDKFISYMWADMEGADTTVEITLESKEKDSTFVRITEKEKDNDEKGIQWLKGNTEGWANFLACLKAYLEYGINLRKNAFDPSQMPEATSK